MGIADEPGKQKPVLLKIDEYERCSTYLDCLLGEPHRNDKSLKAKTNLEQYLKYHADDCTVYYWNKAKGQYVAINARCIDFTERAARLFMMRDDERCFVLPSELGYIMTDLQKGDYIECGQALFQITPGLFTEGLYRFMVADFQGQAWAYFASQRETMIER